MKMNNVELITNLVNHTAGTIEGSLLGGAAYHSRKNERENFVQDNGPEEIIELLELQTEDDNFAEFAFEIEQLLRYYFPINDEIPNNEKLLQDAVDNFVDMKYALTENEDIENKLIETNIERVCNNAFSNIPENIKFTNNQIKEAQEMFEMFAKMDKFYRYADDEYEAIAFYKRHAENPIVEDENSYESRFLAFKLAHEYYHNRVLYYTLSNHEDEIVSRLSEKLKSQMK